MLAGVEGESANKSWFTPVMHPSGRWPDAYTRVGKTLKQFNVSGIEKMLFETFTFLEKLNLSSRRLLSLVRVGTTGG